MWIYMGICGYVWIYGDISKAILRWRLLSVKPDGICHNCDKNMKVTCVKEYEQRSTFNND